MDTIVQTENTNELVINKEEETKSRHFKVVYLLIIFVILTAVGLFGIYKTLLATSTNTQIIKNVPKVTATSNITSTQPPVTPYTTSSLTLLYLKKDPSNQDTSQAYTYTLWRTDTSGNTVEIINQPVVWYVYDKTHKQIYFSLKNDQSKVYTCVITLTGCTSNQIYGLSDISYSIDGGSLSPDNKYLLIHIHKPQTGTLGYSNVILINTSTYKTISLFTNPVQTGISVPFWVSNTKFMFTLSKTTASDGVSIEEAGAVNKGYYIVDYSSFQSYTSDNSIFPSMISGTDNDMLGAILGNIGDSYLSVYSNAVVFFGPLSDLPNIKDKINNVNLSTDAFMVQDFNHTFAYTLSLDYPSYKMMAFNIDGNLVIYRCTGGKCDAGTLFNSSNMTSTAFSLVSNTKNVSFGNDISAQEFDLQNGDKIYVRLMNNTNGENTMDYAFLVDNTGKLYGNLFTSLDYDLNIKNINNY